MPRRRRTSKLRSDSETVEMFVHNTGYGATLLTGQPTFSDEEDAAAAWELRRTATWSHEHRPSNRPPYAATLHDGIGRAAVDLVGRAPAEEVRQAADADAASVDAFRRSRPAAARAIDEHLDAYLAVIATAAAIAEIDDEDALDAALRRFETAGRP
ncbi:MAG: hypothetical protein KY452_03640 [Actinobacteria bacterium]|nr:hypothetical protein [Actinomycetota bacterium]